jgi:hypothetical protein
MQNVSHVPHYEAAYVDIARQTTERTRSKESILQKGKQIAAAAAEAAAAQDAYWRSLIHPSENLHEPPFSPPPQCEPDSANELTKEQLAETSNWFRNDPEPPLYLSFSS